MTGAAPRRARAPDPGARAVPVTVRGTGPLHLVLIHGWACNRGFWRHQLAAPREGTTVVALDLPGHGAAAPSAVPSVEGFASDVVRVVDALPPSDVVLVGHSMGGAVAVEAAISRPGRCRLVVGVDTFTDAGFYRPRPPREVARRIGAFAADWAGTMAAMLRRITLAGGLEVAAWIAGEMIGADPAAAVPALEALLGWDVAARWPLLPCAAEAINSATLTRGIDPVSGLDGLRVHLMDGVGHFPMLEAPRRFADLLGEVVGRHAGPP